MLFNVWNPARLSPDEIGFDVTRANAPRVGSGDPEWIAACLAAVGVRDGAREWSIEAGRCHFYSDYTDESEWQDRWPETWTVRVRLDGPAPADFGRPESVPKLVDRYDRTWRRGEADAGHDRRALLVALFRDAAADPAPIRDCLLASLSPGLGPAPPTVDRPGGRWMRFRVALAGELFPARVDALEHSLRVWRSAGGVVNRNDLS